MKNLSFSDWDNSDGESSVNQSVESKSQQIQKEYTRDGSTFQEGVHSILPSLYKGDEWFADEESAVNTLRGVAPMVYEWASRAHEDGYPVPTLVEELVEKNGLAAAL
jgi:hypothetical protein